MTSTPTPPTPPTPPTYPKIKYQLNILIDTEDEIESEYLLNYYSKFATKDIGDSGIDLVTPDEIIFLSSKVITLNYKIKCSMINLETNEFTSYYLYPRSSISNTPLQLANSVGVIDAGYRGFIMSKFRNFDIDYMSKRGERLCQICAPDLQPISVKLTTKLDETTRGEGGFGSTGK